MRTTIITQSLDVPFISLILKYDYYIEGTIDHKIEYIGNIHRIIKISKDQLLLCTDFCVSLYDLKTVKIISSLHDVLHVELLPENRIVTSYIDGLLQIWSLNDLITPIHEFQSFVSYTLKIFMLPKNKIALYGLDNNIPIWDLKHTIIELKGHTGAVKCMAIYKNKLLSGSEDTTLKIWNLDTNMCESTLTGHEQTVNNILVSQDNLIISSSIYGNIRIWDSEVCQRVIDCDMPINRIIITKNKIITCYKSTYSKYNEIHVWNLYEDSKDILTGHTKYIINIHLLPNGDLMSSSSDKSIRIWDLEENKCINTWNNDHTPNLFVVCLNKIITDYANGSKNEINNLYVY